MAVFSGSAHSCHLSLRAMAVALLALVILGLTYPGTASSQTVRAWVELDVIDNRNVANLLAISASTPSIQLTVHPTLDGTYAIAAGPFERDAARALLESLKADPTLQWKGLKLSDGSGYLGSNPAGEDGWQASPDDPESRPGLDLAVTHSSSVTTGSPSTDSGALPTAPREAPSLETPGAANAIDYEIVPLSDARKLQIALKLLGYYPGEIDGIFGSRSFAGLHRFLLDRNLPKAESIDAPQVRNVYDEVAESLGPLDFHRFESTTLGMRILFPSGLPTFGQILPPYVSFQPTAGGDLSMTLISALGNQRMFEGLYQTLRDYVETGQHRAPFSNQAFSIVGERDGMNVYARAIHVNQSRIRGVVLSWPQDGTRTLAEAARLIATSLTETSDSGFYLQSMATLDHISQLGSDTAVARSPVRFGSGFHLGAEGHVVTSHSNVKNCDQILVDVVEEYTVRDSDSDHDLVLLEPVTGSTAYAFADLHQGDAQAGPGIFTAGYPFNDGLSDPTITKRTLRRVSQSEGANFIMTIDGPVARGEIGGPVADETGVVIGMLAIPQETSIGLPAGYAMVTGTDHLADLLTRNAISIDSALNAERLNANNLNVRMQGYTVPVHCYTDPS